MGSMTPAISQSISQALGALPGPSYQAPALAQSTLPPTSRTNLTDGLAPSLEHVDIPRKRACPRQAEKSRAWKTARMLPEPVNDSEGESIEEAHEESLGDSVDELADVALDPSGSGQIPLATRPTPTPSERQPDDLLIDSLGEPLFNPDELHHPRSAEWLPATLVAQYLEAKIRTPLSRESRNKLRAECPRPIIPHKICETPSVDPKMVQFLAKTGFNPKKGLDSALKAVQDKLLDITGPLAKIFDLAETAKAEGKLVDPVELGGWIQRAICITGNVNTSLAIERRKAILMKVEPKLSNLALSEAGKEAQGLLFGEPFIKELGRYVGAFTALDKAQSSMKRVFNNRFSNRAGSSRGRLSGRSYSHSRGTGRGSYTYRSSLQDQTPALLFSFERRSRPIQRL
ncbi:uncharacterized protein LOC121002763 [Bufo bufo]|uniref:uncharacterized protein LOC121002763 n=1 Tax=Bufo bufo TaxID=8384 RepID=UPI001ABE49D0|nr:uncharacterized protein LOC121002763 [Bufo bufo]